MCMCTCVHVHVCDDVMHTADLLLQVFTSSDIEQFLSSHTFIFTGVDKEWQELMILTAKNPSIMQVCLRSGRYGQHFNHQIYFIKKKLKCHPLQKEQYPNTVLISVDLLCSLKLFLPLPPPWLIHNCGNCVCVHSSCPDLLPLLEKMLAGLQKCQKALLQHMDSQRLQCPWFSFLPLEDILELICCGELGSVL